MARRRAKTMETPEETLTRWYAGQEKLSYEQNQVVNECWGGTAFDYLTLTNGDQYARVWLTDCGMNLGGYVVKDLEQ